MNLYFYLYNFIFGEHVTFTVFDLESIAHAHSRMPWLVYSVCWILKGIGWIVLCFSITREYKIGCGMVHSLWITLGGLRRIPRLPEKMCCGYCFPYFQREARARNKWRAHKETIEIICFNWLGLLQQEIRYHRKISFLHMFHIVLGFIQVN